MKSFMYSPLWDQMNQVGRGLHEKIEPIERGVCVRLLGGGEVCKFKFKVGGGLEWVLQIARGGSKLSSKFEGFVGGVFYKVWVC